MSQPKPKVFVVTGTMQTSVITYVTARSAGEAIELAKKRPYGDLSWVCTCDHSGDVIDMKASEDT